MREISHYYAVYNGVAVMTGDHGGVETRQDVAKRVGDILGQPVCPLLQQVAIDLGRARRAARRSAPKDRYEMPFLGLDCRPGPGKFSRAMYHFNVALGIRLTW